MRTSVVRLAGSTGVRAGRFRSGLGAAACTAWTVGAISMGAACGSDSDSTNSPVDAQGGATAGASGTSGEGGSTAGASGSGGAGGLGGIAGTGGSAGLTGSGGAGGGGGTTPADPGRKFAGPVSRDPAMSAQQWADLFDGAVFWARAAGQPAFNLENDIRLANPNGHYFKHTNLLTTSPRWGCKDVGEACAEKSTVYDMPDYEYISTVHPEWMVTDDDGARIALYGFSNYLLDVLNPDCLTWILTEWFPYEFAEEADIGFMNDNGSVVRSLVLDCGYGGDACASKCTNRVCAKYNTNEKWQGAWQAVLSQFREVWGGRYRLILNSVLPGSADEDGAYKSVMAWSDGAVFEELVMDGAHSYLGADIRRGFANAYLRLAPWFAQEGKVFVPFHSTNVALNVKYIGAGSGATLSLADGSLALRSGVPGEEVVVDLGDTSVDTIEKLTAVLDAASAFDAAVEALPYATLSSSALADQTWELVPDVSLGVRFGPIPQESMDYAWAFYNLLYDGELSIFGAATTIRDGGYIRGIWYPEMDVTLGAAKGGYRELQPNIFTREFERAVVFVNHSDAATQLPLPSGRSWRDISGNVVETAVQLRSFGGRVLYASE